MSKKSFTDYINEYLQFLFDDYGYELKVEYGRIYVAESENTQINIYLEKDKTLMVSVSPKGIAEQEIFKRKLRPAKLDILVLLDCIGEKPKKVHLKNLKKAFAQTAEFLRGPLNDFVKGDYQRWDIISECLEKRKAKLN